MFESNNGEDNVILDDNIHCVSQHIALHFRSPSRYSFRSVHWNDKESKKKENNKTLRKEMWELTIMVMNTRARIMRKLFNNQKY